MNYIGYYCNNTSTKERRFAPLAGMNKMDYICDIVSSQYELEVISASGVVGKKSERGSVELINKNVSLRLFFSLGRKNKFIGKLSTVILRLRVFLYLLNNTKADDVVIVYHSLAYIKEIFLLKKIIPFKLLLEVEEIYADVLNNPKYLKEEFKIFNMADAYIFPTQYLSSKINTTNKPNVIIHGNYHMNKIDKDDYFTKIDDGIVHCVYSGTLEPRKGSLTAVLAAMYLPKKYHIHILGFGSNEDISNLKKTINEVSSNTVAKVSYDGTLIGNEYKRFLQNCDIGLCTQDPSADFSDSSFPSKLLSYLGNGLKVVSINLPTIVNSAVGDVITFFDSNEPKLVAEAIIRSAETNQKDGLEVLKKLDDIARKEILEIIEALKCS